MATSNYPKWTCIIVSHTSTSMFSEHQSQDFLTDPDACRMSEQVGLRQINTKQITHHVALFLITMETESLTCEKLIKRPVLNALLVTEEWALYGFR